MPPRRDRSASGHWRGSSSLPAARHPLPPGLRLRDLADLKTEELFALLFFSPELLKPRSFSVSERYRSYDSRYVRPERQQPAELVEDVRVIFGVQNHLVLVLPADIDQRLADRRERRQGSQGAVDVHPVLSGTGHHAADDEFLAVAESRVSLIFFLNPSCPRMSKSASTTAASSKDRIMSAFARSPKRRPTAPMMIDLPAPVSPEMTLRPPSKATFNSSMMAKLRMLSSASILPLPGSPRLGAAPSQFRPQDLQIAPVGRGDQRGECRDFRIVMVSPGLHGKGNLSVEGHGRPLLQRPDVT